jgi:hypothetical protein
MAALCCITLLQLTHTFFLFAIFLSSFYTRKIVTSHKKITDWNFWIYFQRSIFLSFLYSPKFFFHLYC